LNNALPLVSVIVPVYNREKLILQTLESIRKQTYRPIEILVVDDGSTDQTFAVVEAWASAKQNAMLRINLYRHEHAGAPTARNYGIRTAQGKYLQFLDSDDTFEKEKIEQQVLILEKTQADIAICDFQYVNEAGHVLKMIRNDGPLRKKMIFKEWSLSIFAPLIRTQSVANIVWWNEKLTQNQDMDYLFKVMAVVHKVVYTSGIWCNYVQHEESQISDGCLVKWPRYEQRIWSLFIFLFVAYRHLTLRGKVMCVGGIIILSKIGLLWRPKRFVKRWINKP